MVCPYSVKLGLEPNTASLTSNIRGTNIADNGELLPTVILVIDSMGYHINLSGKTHTITIIATLLFFNQLLSNYI